MKTASIPTFVINLEKREDRRLHILEEFSGREEFDVTIVKAIEHQIGAVGLWNTIQEIIGNLVDGTEEFILICEDDHQFTTDYSSELLFNCITNAKEMGADFLSGGVSWFNNALQVCEHTFWVEQFTGTQFIIIFKHFFKELLETKFEDQDTADHKIYTLSERLFLIYPFISTQREFGYSDATSMNNEDHRVELLFKKSIDDVQILKDVDWFYNKKQPKVDIHAGSFDNVFIPTYIINLCERTERREHIVKQFSGRTEFDTVIVDAVKHEIGAVGLWKSIIAIIKMAADNDDDVIVICEDDHEFTEHYNRDVFIRNIIEANAQGVDYLSGGIGYFFLAVQVSEHRFWVNPSSATQFIVIYKRFFDKILNEPYDDNVIADILLSGMTGNKMVMYPFISMQRDFGYSDVTPAHNSTPGLVDCLFSESSRKLGVLRATAEKFCQKTIDI